MENIVYFFLNIHFVLDEFQIFILANQEKNFIIKKI